MKERKRKEVMLPSGKVAMVYDPVLARDQRAAIRMSGNDASSVPYAMIAAVASINGSEVTLEDVLEMPLGDVQALQAEVMGNGRSSAPGTSSS
jgi:hypothetical protein